MEGRGTEGRGMKQRLKDRRGPREIKKKDERDRRREVSKFEKRYSTRGLQMSSLQLNKTVVVNEHRCVSYLTQTPVPCYTWVKQQQHLV